MALESCSRHAGIGDHVALEILTTISRNMQLLAAGRSQREIERMTGVDRKTIRRYGQEICAAAAANSPTLATGSEGRESGDSPVEIPPPRPPVQPPKLARSACEEHREWIESQVALGRNAVSIYQDLVDRMGFAHRYKSVKRFVRTLRKHEPERFDILGAAGANSRAVTVACRYCGNLR